MLQLLHDRYEYRLGIVREVEEMCRCLVFDKIEGKHVFSALEVAIQAYKEAHKGMGGGLCDSPTIQESDVAAQPEELLL